MKIIILAALAVFVTGAPAAEPKAAKPNLVFFLADDLRPDCLGVLGHSIVKTPNLADKEPAKVKELAAKLEAWQVTLPKTYIKTDDKEQ